MLLFLTFECMSPNWHLETTKFKLINPRIKDVDYNVKSCTKENGESKFFDLY